MNGWMRGDSFWYWYSPQRRVVPHSRETRRFREDNLGRWRLFDRYGVLGVLWEVQIVDLVKHVMDERSLAIVEFPTLFSTVLRRRAVAGRFVAPAAAETRFV